MEAIERVTGRPAEGYLCPLCLRWCTTIDDVRLEHAPPRSLGGRHVVLTCDECNHSAGYRLEGELRKAEDIRQWAAREGGVALPARVELDGIPLSGEAMWVDETLSVVGIPSQNDPRRTEAHVAAARERPLIGGNDDFRLTVGHRVDWPRVRVAWLKSGYVAAFALLGYQWALRSALDIVRTQIADPTFEHVERFYLPRRQGTSDRHAVIWFERPRSLESIFVVLGNHAVFLPGLKPWPRIYERLAERLPAQRRTS